MIKARFNGKSNKKTVGLYLAEVAVMGEKNALSKETIYELNTILDFAKSYLVN